MTNLPSLSLPQFTELLKCCHWYFCNRLSPSSIFLQDDYVDDEPYRNALDEEMQGDAPGVLTEQKYQELGNEKGVQQARERYIQEQKRPSKYRLS